MIEPPERLNFFKGPPVSAQLEAWFSRLAELAAWVHEQLVDVVERGADGDTVALKAHFKRWLRHSMENMAVYSEIRFVGGLPSTLHMHLFAELSRMHLLSNYAAMRGERRMLESHAREDLSLEYYEIGFSLALTRHDMWMEIRDSYVARAQSESEENEVQMQARETEANLAQMWKRPLMEYKQSEVMVLLIFLSQQLFSAPSTDAGAMGEFTRVHRLCWARCAELIVQFHPNTVLDVEAMRAVSPVSPGEYHHTRNFWAMASFYVMNIERHLFVWDLMQQLRVPVEPQHLEMGERLRGVVKRWLDDAGEDTLITILQKQMDEAYDFPGDAKWFRFLYPDRVFTRGACIAALRPHLYAAYFSETYLTCDAAIRASRTQHTARLSMLHAVELMLQRYHPNLKWLDGVKIENGSMEGELWKFETELCPLLFQPVSNYWVYWRDKVYASDDVFVSMALWFHLLMRDCGGQFHKYDLTQAISDMRLDEPDGAAQTAASASEFFI